MKKIFIIGIAAMLLLTGCGGDSENGKGRGSDMDTSVVTEDVEPAPKSESSAETTNNIVTDKSTSGSKEETAADNPAHTSESTTAAVSANSEPETAAEKPENQSQGELPEMVDNNQEFSTEETTSEQESPDSAATAATTADVHDTIKLPFVPAG